MNMCEISNTRELGMDTIKGKKLLVLAGQDVHRKLVETAQRMGVYTIVADYLENSPCKRIADESSMLSIMDVDGIVEFCKGRHIDGIANFCNDPASRIVQQVSERMGYPSIGSWNQVEIFTNKGLFKAACVRNGIDVIQEYSETDIKSGSVDYPVLVKPIDSRGSRGSTICESAAEFDKAFSIAKESSASGKVLIEKYMGGHQELSITYVVINGEPHLISVGDRHSGMREYNVDKILSCMIQPSWALGIYLNNVDAKVKNMIKEIGVQNAAVFMQGFVDGDTVRMFDPGYRFAGNEYERAYVVATGVDPMESIISYALTGKMEDFGGKYEGSYDLNGKVAVQYMINGRPGTIAKYIGVNEVEQHPEVIYVGRKYEIGERIENTGSTKHRIFDITFLVNRTEKAVNDVVNYVNKHLHVLDENGDDMIISRFDFMKYAHLYGWPKE